MATSVGSTARCCANLQQALDEAVDFAPNATRLKLGVMEALMSPNNRDGVQVAQMVSQLGTGVADGATACKIEIEFELPDCVAATASEIDICGAVASIGDTRGYLQQEVTRYAGRAGTWTLDEFDCICESPDERLAKTMMKLARSINKAIEIDAVTQIATYLSNYADGTDSTDVAGGNTRTLNILNSAGHVNASEWSKLRAEYRKQFSMDDPILVGGDILAQYDDVRLAGLGANAVGNTNPDQLVNDNRFISYELDSAMDTALGSPAKAAGTSYAISWMPGAIQMLEYLENQGRKEWFYEQSSRTTITIDGVVYDWYLKFEECGSAGEPHWKFKLEKRYDFFHIPASVYSSCFPSNGNLLWLLGCGDATCIDVV